MEIKHFADLVMQDGWAPVARGQEDREALPKQVFGKPWRRDPVLAQTVFVGQPEPYTPAQETNHTGPVPERAVLFHHRVVTMGIQGGTRVFKESHSSHADPSGLPHVSLLLAKELDTAFEDPTHTLARATYGGRQRHVPTESSKKSR
jgi:hypothetical protein